MFNALILTFGIVFCALPTHGMDPAPIPDKQMIAWEIILGHGVKWFNYRMIHSLVLNKQHDKLLRDTAQYRKTYLCKQLHLKSDNLIWHKYGAMCSKVYFEGKALCAKRLYLDKPGWQGQPPSVSDGVFNQCLPHQPAAYFNNKTAFCYYTYYTNGLRGPGCIYKNILPSQKIPQRLGIYKEVCVAGITDGYDRLIDLKILLEFPPLLKAFLKSRKVYAEKINWWIYNCDTARVYDIRGVTIPKNYKEHKKYFSTVIYPSFDKLPKVVRKAVEARYRQQKQKRKSSMR